MVKYYEKLLGSILAKKSKGTKAQIKRNTGLSQQFSIRKQAFHGKGISEYVG